MPQGTRGIDHRIDDPRFDEFTLPPNQLKVISVDHCTGIVECEYIPLGTDQVDVSFANEANFDNPEFIGVVEEPEENPVIIGVVDDSNPEGITVLDPNNPIDLFGENDNLPDNNFLITEEDYRRK